MARETIDYDGAGNILATTPLPARPPRALTKFEFLSLFSGEKIDAALALKATTLARFWAFYEAAASFERDHPATTLGLDALEATEVIDSEYRAAVLAIWPTV